MFSVLVLAIAAAAGCANDPEYLPQTTTITVMDDGMGNLVGNSFLVLPIKPETRKDRLAREALATKLGLAADDVPYVKVGDLDISVEWTIKNMENTDAQAKIELNGATQYFKYDPSVIVLDPTDDEAPPTPGLQGDIPIDVPAGGIVDGVFREDQLLEASIDLDAITRGNENPFAATLTVQKNAPSFDIMMRGLSVSDPVCLANPMDTQCQLTSTGMSTPRAAFASIVRVDIVFKPDHNMTLDYTVRVRDHRGIMHDMGMSAPASQVTYAPDFDPGNWMP
jgi:hypothetical protein